MPNSNYVAGRRFEYQIMKDWNEREYSTIRASGSHGLFDVVAFRSDRPVDLIQCKVVSTEAICRRLQGAFIMNPPLTPSKFFHQILAVKVKGSPGYHHSTV